jgi:hypothetical protein
MKNEEVESLAPVNPLEQDPPIIVGGGGSAFVWIKRSLATQVTDLSTIPSTAPHPAVPSDFIVYKVDADITVAVVTKGNGTTAVIHNRMNPRMHSTAFDL